MSELDDLKPEQILKAKINQLKVIRKNKDEEPYKTTINHLQQVLEALENQPYENHEEEQFWLIQAASRKGFL